MSIPRVALSAALAAAGLALAQQAPPGGGGEIALELKPGEAKSLCPCPVSRLLCDDPALVKLVEDAAGQSLEGVKPGTTVCSLDGPTGRRVYRVTVVERGAKRK